VPGFGKLIADTIFANDPQSRDVAERRVSCKLAASLQMFCHCGKVLDQHTVCVLERVRDDGWKTTIIVACPTCRVLMDGELRKMIAAGDKAAKEGQFSWLTWDAQDAVVVGQDDE